MRPGLLAPRFFVLLVIGLTALAAIVVAACRQSNSLRNSPPDIWPPHQSVTTVKIFVRQDGIYELTSTQLRAAGVRWESVDSARLHLLYQGREQPLWTGEQGGAFSLRFYGQASSSLYARDNVYWLQLGDGPARQMEKDIAASASHINQVDHYMATVHLEENLLYSPQASEGEHWFWASLPAPQAMTCTFPLTNVASGPGYLRLEVWSSTEGPESPDHHLRVWVNGQSVTDAFWDGQIRYTVRADLPAGLLVEGTNVVRVEAPGDTRMLADVTFVDWIQIRYPSLFVAQADRIEFESPGGLHRLTGFTGPAVVFDVSDAEGAVQVTDDPIASGQQQNSTTLVFVGKQGHRYIAVGPKGFLSPVGIVPVAAEPDLRASNNGADYIAIGPPDLLEPLQPLLRWRESQGLKVVAIPVEVIYDQFNHGLPEPQAIRAFLDYAVHSWRTAPQYVLLAGDATFDPKGYVAPPEANRLPTFLIPTVFGGETASDVSFVQFDDDVQPAVAIGRIPAREAQQVRAVVAKTLSYEQQPPAGPWRKRVLAIADGQEASFRQDAQAFLNNFSGDFQTVLFTPSAGESDAAQQIKRYWDEGYLVVGYFGHGSINQWGKDRLLTVTDVTALPSTRRLPIVVNMTCLTGLFSHPKVVSLAETLLWQPDGGAVAILAPTSLTLAADQSFLSDALAKTLVENPQIALGQILLRSQHQISAGESGVRDVIQTFLLFGDPALHLAYGD